MYVVFASPYVSKCSSSSRSLARRLERYSALPPPQPHTRASQHCVAYPQTVHRALDMAFWLATTRLLSFGITMWTLLLLSYRPVAVPFVQLLLPGSSNVWLPKVFKPFGIASIGGAEIHAFSDEDA